MTRHRGPVLVDTNVILECYRVGAWQALSNGYSVETTKVCMEETQTGFRQRPQAQWINPQALRQSLNAVHAVGGSALTKLESRTDDLQLGLTDAGEKSLWAYVLSSDDDWVLCGPDIVSLRCGVLLGFREKIASLEQLLMDVGHQPKIRLRHSYTNKWLRKTLNELVVTREA